MKEKSSNNETMKIRDKNYPFTVLRPGGNDTCLIKTSNYMPMPDERKRINDFMQEMYPNVEQVGFVTCSPFEIELMMAGGEFCGNATRSTAWDILKGEPGEIQIKVSGVRERLRAGVTENGEAFAQMPIYPETLRITRDTQTGFIVEMEGIVHYIDFDESATKGLSQSKIKAKAAERLKEKELDQYPAAGVIYARTDNNGLRIEPIVYVRDINTLYYETACGSGTTALGLILALEKNSSIKDLPIIQPSDMAIKVSIDFDRESFKYAQIQGKVEMLNNGNVEIKKV